MLAAKKLAKSKLGLVLHLVIAAFVSEKLRLEGTLPKMGLSGLD